MAPNRLIDKTSTARDLIFRVCKSSVLLNSFSVLLPSAITVGLFDGCLRSGPFYHRRTVVIVVDRKLEGTVKRFAKSTSISVLSLDRIVMSDSRSSPLSRGLMVDYENSQLQFTVGFIGIRIHSNSSTDNRREVCGWRE